MKTVVLDKPEDLQKVFDGMAADFEAIDFEEAMKAELGYLADLHKSYFDSSTGPDGQAWGANAPSTIEAKGHSVILRGRQGTRQQNIKATRRRPSVHFSRGKNIAGFRLATSLTTKTEQSFGDSIREAVRTDNGAMLTFGSGVEYAGDERAGRPTNYAPQGRPHIGMTAKYLDEATGRVADFTMEQLKK